jgi:hypothetical protein
MDNTDEIETLVRLLVSKWPSNPDTMTPEKTREDGSNSADVVRIFRGEAERHISNFVKKMMASMGDSLNEQISAAITKVNVDIREAHSRWSKLDITDAERKAFIRLMEDYSNNLGNAGCNDFSLDDTPENRIMVRHAQVYCRSGEEDAAELHVHDGQIQATDFEILYYLIHKIKGE